jgi:hypothetical protein
MTRELLFWHHYLAEHQGHGITTFSTSAAVASLLCLFVVACWTTAQVAARCCECAAIPARCRCGRHR